MLILCAAVTLWVGGFDVLYACQDVEFDRQPASTPFPSASALPARCCIARVMHVGVVAACSPGWPPALRLPWPAWAGIVVVAALLAYEHSLVKAERSEQAERCVFHRERLY